MGNNLESFIEALKNDEDGEKLGRPLALLPQGRWDLLIGWARGQGFDFDAADLELYLQQHPRIPAIWADHPQLKQWNLATLRDHIQRASRE